MEQAVTSRTPVHLWIVGILSLIWNGFGGVDYTMTRLRNRDYLASTGMSPDVILAYIDAMPMWAQFGWGLGVWGALLGSVLLLMRSRWAVHAFAASFVGALLSLGAQLAASNTPAEMSEGAMALVPYFILAVALALLLYARAMHRKGVLR